jgi:hypothetical protein
MTFWPANLGWQPQWDNPDFRGWSVVAVYVVAAGFCARTALALRKMGPEEKRESAVWRLLALGLLFLGINKQLNLQTLLIVLCRRGAAAGGWLEKGRLAQMVFSAALTVAGLALIWRLRVRFRRFFAGNRWVFTGLVVLFLFVLIRAASINHVFKWAGVQQKDEQGDKKWTWVLEIVGSACLAFAATKAGRQSSRGQQ